MQRVVNSKAKAGLVAGVMTAASIGAAWAADPAIPYVASRTGEVVVLVSAGLDYRRPAIADRLARDGEGEAIAWDFADGNARPFADAGGPISGHVAGDGTALAEALIAASPVANGREPVLLAPVRIDPADAAGAARAIAFASRTPARAILVALARPQGQSWTALAEAAARVPHITIVLADCVADGGADQPPGRVAPNVVHASDIGLLSREADSGGGTWVATFAGLACPRAPR